MRTQQCDRQAARARERCARQVRGASLCSNSSVWTVSIACSIRLLGTPVLGYCILISFSPRRYSDGTETGRRALAFAQVAHTPRSRQVHPQVSYARDPTVMDPAAWDKRLKYDAEWILEGYIQRLKDLHEKAMRRIEHLKQEGLRTEQQAHHPAYTRYTTP